MENDALVFSGQDTSFMDVWRDGVMRILDAGVDATVNRLRRDGPSQPSINLGGTIETNSSSSNRDWVVPAIGLTAVAVLLARPKG